MNATRQIIERRRIQVPNTPGNYPGDRVDKILSSDILSTYDKTKIEEESQKLNRPHTVRGKVLVADIRNFTYTMEHNSDKHIQQFLNSVFSAAATIFQQVDSGSAYVNKLLGDGLFAHVPDQVSPDNMVDAAKKMIIAFNSRKKSYRLKHTNLSVAITDADYMISAIGGHQYSDYTLLGAEINSLFRMLSATEGGLIYITKSIKNKLNNTHHLIYIGQKEFKGLVSPVPCFSVIRKKSDQELVTVKNEICDVDECPDCYRVCHNAYMEGQKQAGRKKFEYVFELDCIACGANNQCWYWDYCDKRIKNQQDGKSCTCCHICNNFRNCFHSYQLGRHSFRMLTCDKDIYKSFR